jgi:hypothetical protein
MATVTLGTLRDYWKKVNDWIDGNATTTPPVQLTGRIIEELTPVNAVALTTSDTVNYNADISKYKGIYVVAENSHDVDLTVSFRPDTNQAILVWDGASWNSQSQYVTLQANSPRRYLINTQNEYLNDLLAMALSIGITPSGTPTSGSVTVTVYGVKN